MFYFPATLSDSCSRCFWESQGCLLKLDHSVSPPPPSNNFKIRKLIWMSLYGVLVSFATHCVLILCSVFLRVYKLFIGHLRLLSHHEHFDGLLGCLWCEIMLALTVRGWSQWLLYILEATEPELKESVLGESSEVEHLDYCAHELIWYVGERQSVSARRLRGGQATILLTRWREEKPSGTCLISTVPPSVDVTSANLWWNIYIIHMGVPIL